MKLRPVFNGAPLTTLVRSALPTGCEQSVVQTLGILRRFRLCSNLDPRQAFLQLELSDPRDQDCMAFFWEDVPYPFTRVLFGCPCSPHALVRSLSLLMYEAS